jgi:hypothetical protein
MPTKPMSQMHQTATPAPWLWPLPAGRAAVLPRAATPRWLRVAEGRVWLTAMSPASAEAPPADIWLAAGEAHALPPGTAWVLEGWPQASVAVLQAAPEAAAG